MRRSLKQVGVKQLYNPVPQEIRVSLESVVAVRSSENQTQQRAGPSGTPVEQPRRMRKKCCYSQKSRGSICCSLYSVSNSPLTYNPFVTLSNKVRGIFFLKNCVSFVIIVLTMFLRAYEYVTVVVPT